MPGRQEQGVRSLGAGVIGVCELLEVGSGKGIQVLWKTSKCLNC